MWLTMNDFLLARQYISSLEDCVELNGTGINFAQVDKVYKTFSNEFTPYQEYKGGHNRYALPLVTSPDDDSFLSLQETTRSELDFKKHTDYLRYTPSLEEFINKFEHGRAHAISLRKGGFFPPHRDGPIPPRFDEECFRILVTLDGCENDKFITLIDNKVLPLKSFRAYYINSFKTHSAFSFSDDTLFVILNFRISLENLKVLRSML